MKHLEPTPQPGFHVSGSEPKRKKRTSGLSLVLAGIAIIGSIGFGLTHFVGTGTQDSISDARRQELIQDFLGIGTVQLKPVAKADVDMALASMKLPPGQAQVLKQDLDKVAAQPGQEPTGLAWLDIWDFASQDGDVVHVSSAGYEVDVPMLNAVTRIVVPVDASMAVVLTGAVDGGGGITMGVQTGAGELLLPVLVPGEPLTLRVALQFPGR